MHVHRHLPTGGVELHLPVGGVPQLLGPLTAPSVEEMAPGSIVLGIRLLPGEAPSSWAAIGELADQRVPLADVWRAGADRIGEIVSSADDPACALDRVQDLLAQLYAASGSGDGVVSEAVRRLMPWSTTPVASVAADLALSAAQLRRRCIGSVGLTPKTLQRTLRLQGFLALAQAGAAGGAPPRAGGLSELAAEVGYADQAHLTRECLRLTGQTPRQLLHGATDHCACGHDHAASYRPFLKMRETFNRSTAAGT